MPDNLEEDDDVMMGHKANYKAPKSPKTLEEHLKNGDENMIHFKSLAKYYGITA